MREITKLIVGAFLTMTIELIVLRLEKDFGYLCR